MVDCNRDDCDREHKLAADEEGHRQQVQVEDSLPEILLAHRRGRYCEKMRS